jgi:putative DNA primase/helicase
MTDVLPDTGDWADEDWPSDPPDDQDRDDAKPETFGAVKLAELAEPALRGKFRWCPELGWLGYDGTKWAVDAEPEVLRAVVEVIRTYTIELVTRRPLSREDHKELGGFSNGSTQNHAIKILRGAPGVRTKYSDFDALPATALGQPWIVPCANGITVELHADGTRKVRPTTPDDLNTKTACAYDPDAKAPGIEAAFSDYQPDENVRRYQLQMWCRGLSGMGAENFIANIGEGGGNGKGTMWGCVAAAAGEYAAELPVEVILKSRGAAREVYRSELANLRGCRLLFCEEPTEGAVYDLGILKRITGGGNLDGRAMGKDAVSFPAKWLFEMAANGRPGWPADDAMTRRYVEIAWNFSIQGTVPGGGREDFKEALKAEASGLLNLILEHWTGTTKPVMPDVVDAQTRDGSAKASPLAPFAADALVPAPDSKSAAADLFHGYLQWARTASVLAPMTQQKFGRELPRLGYAKDVDRKGTWYLGVVLDERYETGAFRAA